MTSFLGKITRTIIRAYTYPYRKNHLSLSRSIKFKQTPYKVPNGYEYHIDIYNGIKVECISMKNYKKDILILHFHGGGCTTPMTNIYRKIAKKYCDITSMPVLSIDYNIGKDKVHPSLLNDCYIAYMAMLNTCLKDKKIIMVGDSNGANLMFGLCFMLRDKGLNLPIANIVISPFVDFSASGESYKKNCYNDPMYSLPRSQRYEDYEYEIRRFSPYCANVDKTNPYLSPAFGEYNGFNNILIQVGSYETSESDSDILYEKASEANVYVELQKFEGMFHDFQYFCPYLKESRVAWKNIEKFISKMVNE